MEAQEETTAPKKPKFKYQYDLFNLFFVAIVFWAIYEPVLRSIVFWMILILNSLALIFGAIALKNEVLKPRHLINLLIKLALVVVVIFGFLVPELGSKICAIMFVLQLFQMVEAYYLRHLKSERRTEERKGAMNR